MAVRRLVKLVGVNAAFEGNAYGIARKQHCTKQRRFGVDVVWRNPLRVSRH
jgi:hypothetical protein